MPSASPVKSGEGLIVIRQATQNLGYAVYDQSGAMLFSANHHKPPVGADGCRPHIKAAALIDDGKDFTSKIDNAFQKFRGLWKTCNLVWHPCDFFDRFDRQRKFLLVEPENEKPKFLCIRTRH